MDDFTSAPETGTDITDQLKSRNTLYMECVLICPSDLMTIIEINIRKDPLPSRITATWPTDKTIEWSLAFSKTMGGYYNLLLVGSGHESYPT